MLPYLRRSRIKLPLRFADRILPTSSQGWLAPLPAGPDQASSGNGLPEIALSAAGRLPGLLHPRLPPDATAAVLHWRMKDQDPGGLSVWYRLPRPSFQEMPGTSLPPAAPGTPVVLPAQSGSRIDIALAAARYRRMFPVIRHCSKRPR